MKLRILAITAVGALLMFLTPTGASAANDARIHLIHGIPDTDVDVIVDSAAVLESVSFGDTNDLSSFAGQTLKGLQVNLAGTDTTAIDAGDTALPASGNYTVIAHLNAEGTPALAVFENDTSKIDAGEGRLVVRHAAAAPAVDVKADGEVAFPNLLNGKEGKADLPTGTISATVVPAGADDPVVIGPADLKVAEGESLIVYAVGSLDDKTLSVLTETVEGIHSNPNKVNTGTSPVGSSSGPTSMLVLGGLAAAFVAGTSLTVRRRQSAATAA